MKYRCKSIPMMQLVATNQGFLQPLCNDCQTLDCENDIEIKKISILGITVESKLLTKKDDSYMVVGCEGYINNDEKTKPSSK